MSKISQFLVIVVGASLLLISQSIFIVRPDQTAMVVHLGELRHDAQGNVIRYQSGLHFKLPFVDRLIKIDKRLQSFDVPSSRVLTQDQKSVNVDYYVKWYVKDFSLFYQRTGGNYYYARDLIRRKTSDSLRAEFGVRSLTEIISGEERSLIIDRMQKSASESVENIGLRISDVRLKRVDYPVEVTLSVYERMKSSRHRDAKRYRAEGMAQSEKIRSGADKDAMIIVVEAERKAAEVVAKAKNEAAGIFNRSYSKAPDFYSFYIRMEGYNESISPSDTMLISPQDNQYYSELAVK